MIDGDAAGANARLDALFSRFPALAPTAPDLLQAFELMRKALQAGGRLLLCGNGGSAADCEHWSGELLKGFCRARALDASWRGRLSPELFEHLQGALACIPLTSFHSISTAYANDVCPEFVYAQLVWALGRPEDVVVGISTSGNSRNICAALEVARAKEIPAIGLTGGSGGCMAELADCCIRVPGEKTYEVQEMHQPIYHALSLMLEDAFFGTDGGS